MFATVVGLMSDFVFHRSGDEAQTLVAYVAWLRWHEHREVVAYLEDNRDLQAAIQSLMQLQQSEVLAILNQLNSLMLSFASRIETIQPIAAAIDKTSILSSQAKSILRQLNAANASRFFELRLLDDVRYPMVDGDKGEIAFSEPRFMDDDINTLVSLNLLFLVLNPNGDKHYRITRAGAKVGG